MSPSPPILPFELIIEILSRLQAKFLIRFRCVSKHWKSLLFDPSFIKLHLQNSPKHTHRLLASIAPTLPFYSTVPWKVTEVSVHNLLEHPSSTGNQADCLSFRQGSFHSVASANGLICLIQKDNSEEFYIQFCNPTLRLRSKKSPNLKVTSPHFAFGYDDSTDKYKVVAVYWDRRLKKREGRIHCMGDSHWRNTLACPDFPMLLATGGLFVNDSVNWLSIDDLTIHKHNFTWERVTMEQLMIFSLDLRKETCKYMLLPEGFCERPQHEPTLAAIRGRLCLFLDHAGTHFIMWEMREFGVEESWTQLVSLNYMHLQIHDIMSDLSLLPVCLSENGDDLLFAFKHGNGIIYSRRYNRIERIQLNNGLICYADEHMQSLVLPHPPLYY